MGAKCLLLPDCFNSVGVKNKQKNIWCYLCFWNQWTIWHFCPDKIGNIITNLWTLDTFYPDKIGNITNLWTIWYLCPDEMGNISHLWTIWHLCPGKIHNIITIYKKALIESVFWEGQSFLTSWTQCWHPMCRQCGNVGFILKMWSINPFTSFCSAELLPPLILSLITNPLISQ